MIGRPLLAIIATVLLLAVVSIIFARRNKIIMRIESGVFEHEGTIPQRYTCDGDNISPPLTFINIPEGTQSLVLVVEDPDVPKSIRADGMFDHWLLWNIPPDVGVLAEGDAGVGATGKNTKGERRYTGPCPPDREHRYFFKLYALDTVLNLDGAAGKEELLTAMEGHIVGEAVLMGRYDRNH